MKSPASPGLFFFLRLTLFLFLILPPLLEFLPDVVQLPHNSPCWQSDCDKQNPADHFHGYVSPHFPFGRRGSPILQIPFSKLSFNTRTSSSFPALSAASTR